MCGIVGYVGDKNVSKLLLTALKKLEYRGYDSAGIAVGEKEGIEIVKRKGKLLQLESAMCENQPRGTFGIGHTRWATHGDPSEINAHPHCSYSGKLVLVHNGIIENFLEIKRMLEKESYIFKSETDTEVICNLIEYFYCGDPLLAIKKALTFLEGSYALAILFAEHEDKIFIAKKESPLIVGLGEGENFVASDVTALLEHTKKVVYLGDEEIAVLSRERVKFYNYDLVQITKKTDVITWGIKVAEMGGYPHFMLKEIHEQGEAVWNTISPRIRKDKIILEELALNASFIKNLKKIYIIGCGSAYHVALNSKYVIESLARIPVEVDIASEFRYRNPIFEKDSLFIVISQSGETADSLASLKLAKKKGALTLAVVNVVGSAIAREADMVFYTHAGAEIAVATTKAFSCQLAAMYIFAIHFAMEKGEISSEQYAFYVKELKKLRANIKAVLDKEEVLKKLAKCISCYKDIFFIGRGIDYAASEEGSLKLKEISYLRSEAYPAGELKHGTISLMEKGVLVVGIVCQEELSKKSLSNLSEVYARGADILLVVKEGIERNEDMAKYVIEIPDIPDKFTTSVSVIALQLLSYYISCYKGLDVDKPRNLAKSVTVE